MCAERQDLAVSERLGRRTTSYVSLDVAQTEVRERIVRGYAEGRYVEEPVACFCGGEGGAVIAQTDRYGLAVTTVLCSDCGLLRTSPRMTAGTCARFYTEDYRALYTAVGASGLFETQVAKGEHFLPVLERLGDGMVVYEVGCGCGGALKPFQQSGHVVAGCDFDKEYLDVGRAQGLNLIEGGADVLLQTTGVRADVVILTHVAEHFLDLRAEFALVRDLIEPGGFLLAEVPGVRSITTDYRGDILLYLQNAHTYHFTAATLRYVLESVGFEVLAADEQVVALARRPLQELDGDVPGVPDGEAEATLAYLRDTEASWAAAQGAS
jgi:SAM-dependent methyltransferase